MGPPVSAADPVLVLSDVSKSFWVERSRQIVEAVEEFTVDVHRGEFFTLVGPSGCGKSTVLGMIAGFEAPSSGTITMNGEAIDTTSAERGMLFQEYALFPWKTVRGNIEFGLKHGPSRQKAAERARIVQHHIDLVGLTGSEGKYPHELSGGMRQRCALARLLACDPEVLLMDEPLAALDAQTRRILQEELLRIWGQERSQRDRKTIIYVTHAIDEAVFLSDRVGVMSRSPGRLKEIVEIELPRPRNEGTRALPRAAELENAIWTLIREDAYRATLE